MGRMDSMHSKSNILHMVNRIPVHGQATSSFAPKVHCVGFQHAPLPAPTSLQAHTGQLVSAVLPAERNGSPQRTHARGKSQGSARAGRRQGTDKPSPLVLIPKSLSTLG